MESRRLIPVVDFEERDIAGDVRLSGGCFRSPPPRAAKRDSTVIFDVESGICEDVEGAVEGIVVGPILAKSLSSLDGLSFV